MKWRLIAALLGLTVVVLLAHDLPLINYLRTVEKERVTTVLERDSFIIAGRAEPATQYGSEESIKYIEKAIAEYSEQSGSRVIVTDDKGIAIVVSNEADKVGNSYLDRPEIQVALTGEVSSGRKFSNLLDQEIIFVSVPILNGDKTLGSVTLTFPATVVDDAVTDRLRGISAVAGITLLISALVALLLALGVTRRLTKLRNVTEEFAKGNYKVRAEIDGGAPEIRSLSRSFNTMADQLDRLISQQKAFAGDASHQLRTPLTALQLRLERATEMLETDPAGAAQRSRQHGRADRLRD